MMMSDKENNTSNAISLAVNRMPASGIRTFFEFLDQNTDVISLAVGQPDFMTPEHISAAASKSMLSGLTGYTSNYGLIELREHLSNHINNLYQVQYNPENEMLLTSGVSEALDIAVRAIIDPGDEVIVPEPAYVAYKPVILLAGGSYVAVPTFIEDDFMVKPELIEQAITSKTKAILLGYPCNPTGGVLSREKLSEIAKIAEKHDLIIIADELYDRLVYGTHHTCFASLPNMKKRTILLGGFSKSYAMTGWRLGYIAAEPEILEAIMKIHQYVMMSAPTAAQYAGIEAIAHGEQDIESMRLEYDARRQFLVNELRSMGFEISEPKGAFYAFPDVQSRTGLDGQEFSSQLLKKHQVAVVPGEVFGESGKNCVRMCYATSMNELEEAITRIKKFIQ
ncbi:MAG: aminotransferase class I/II-fold pyridoxal phosphate-dependent enzyme [Dehalococcoidia bacterium]|nr:aminotransferase class I/II-fold pyridoxal phosphate-dependent enzyme [Dehalococcoidia bacterium]